MKQQIVSRWDSSKVLFECEVPDDVSSGMEMRHALEEAVKNGADLVGAYLGGAYLRGADSRGADLRGAYLRGADLRDADLRGADLRDADLRDADLRGADLGGADLRGAYLRGADLRGADLGGADLVGAYLGGAYLGDVKPATPEQSIENLDKVRAIIMDNSERLEMDHWHETDEWRERSCAEETLCQTTHCLAGWLQVCSTDPEIRKMRSPQLAGTLAAPIAAKMFFKGSEEALEWLRDRKYVQDIEERSKRDAEYEARKEKT